MDRVSISTVWSRPPPTTRSWASLALEPSLRQGPEGQEKGTPLCSVSALCQAHSTAAAPGHPNRCCGGTTLPSLQEVVACPGTPGPLVVTLGQKPWSARCKSCWSSPPRQAADSAGDSGEQAGQGLPQFRLWGRRLGSHYIFPRLPSVPLPRPEAGPWTWTLLECR